MNSEDHPEQRREHFRLLYPAAERPSMEAEGHRHEVVEIAEGGIRIVINRGESMKVGDSLGGEIHFHDDSRESVAGEVLRLDGKLAVIKLASGISLHRLMVEQLYIQKKYPRFIANSRKRPV